MQGTKAAAAAARTSPILGRHSGIDSGPAAKRLTRLLAFLQEKLDDTAPLVRQFQGS